VSRHRQIVWHYTYSQHIEEIVKSGALLPPYMVPGFTCHNDALVLAIIRNDQQSYDQIYADAKSLLFSQRDDWEPASYRGLEIGDQTIELHSIDDYSKYNRDVYRIGVRRSLLRPWTQLPRLVRMDAQMQRALEHGARGLGSNPFDWWGTTRPVLGKDWERIEIYDPSKGWQDISASIAPGQIPRIVG